jgi:hypothetical protein
MANSRTPTTSPTHRPTRLSWRRQIVTQAPGSIPYSKRSNVGQNAATPPFYQPGGPGWRARVPVPGTMWGNVEESTSVMLTGPVVNVCFPPAQEIAEWPAYYPGTGWVSSATNPG